MTHSNVMFALSLSVLSSSAWAAPSGADAPPAPVPSDAARQLDVATHAANHQQIAGVQLTSAGTACAHYVHAQIAAGKPESATVPVLTAHGKVAMSLAAINRDICQPLVALGASWDEVRDRERADLRGPFRRDAARGRDRG